MFKVSSEDLMYLEFDDFTRLFGKVLEVSVERCRSTDVFTALTIFRPSPVSSAVTMVLFPADQVN